jgi:Fe-S cluster assembly protein SufD
MVKTAAARDLASGAPTMNADSSVAVAHDWQFAEARRALPLPALPWLDRLRDEAMARFRHNGFPTQKVEAWKFTGLAPLARAVFRADGAPEAARIARTTIEAHRLTPDCHLAVFVNGRFQPALSDLGRLPACTRVVDLSRADQRDLERMTAPPAVADAPGARALVDLNTALMRDGAVVHLGRGASIDPVQLLFLTLPGAEPGVAHLRNLLLAEAGSSAMVVETHVGLGHGLYWTNAVTQIAVAPNAVLRHYKLQAEDESAFHIAETSVRLEHDAAYRAFALTLGAQLARNELDIALAGEHGEAYLAGATLARGAQHLDTTLRVEHAAPHGTSSQDFKSVVDGRAHAVFQGRIRVAPDAYKTDARQLSRNLLLSGTAAADAKPELEILADDVKCSHGAAVGDLDRDALFYLRTRGLDDAQARALLIEGFVGELIDGIEGEAAQTYFRRAFAAWLGKENQP